MGGIYYIGKIYEIGKNKMSVASDDSPGGRVARALVHGTKSSGFESGSSR